MSKVVRQFDPFLSNTPRATVSSPSFSDTFNQENVTLVDTDGKGIEGVYEKGIIANGKQYEVDCIVWATGFEVGTSWKSRNGFEVYGKNGISIADKWKDGVTTLYGTVMSDFPNVGCVTWGEGESNERLTFFLVCSTFSTRTRKPALPSTS